MATLADSFLQDLEDLEDDNDTDQATDLDGVGANGTKLSHEDENSDDEIPDAIVLYEKEQMEAGAVVSDLATQPEFITLLQQVRSLTDKTPQLVVGRGGDNDDAELQKEVEYQLIEKCNQLVAKVDVEILNIYSFIRDIYSKKFPELESIIFSPLEYIAAVQRIKNETDLTIIDLSDILPSTVTMAVTVASSMTTGHPLPPGELEKVVKAAAEAIQLADCRKDILLYLESRMEVLAPNVTAIIGAALAARLVTHAGGLVSLARMPAQNIMLVGSTGTTAKTGGSSGQGIARGVIYNCDLVQGAPNIVRNRALKLVAGKVSLAARVDSFHESPSGEVGRVFRDKIVQSLIRAQEPPPAPMKKALPTPDEGQKKRRGGKRHRRAKEKYGMSEFRKQANRLAFGEEAEQEVGQDLEGAGFGMIGKGFGHGKLRLQAKQQKVQVKQQQKQQRKAAIVTNTTGAMASSGTTSGMSSSLVFTPMQGIELTNPNLVLQSRPNVKEDQDYFSASSGFLKVETKVEPI